MFISISRNGTPCNISTGLFKKSEKGGITTMFMNEDKIKFENVEIAGFTTAFRGMRNPLDSWHKADSFVCDNGTFFIGRNDMDLAHRLLKGGDEHAKFIRQIYVGVDITLPRYVWSEFDTYHFNVKNSCSTMHTLLSSKKPLTLDMIVYDDFFTDKILEAVTSINRLARCYRGELTTKRSKPEIKRMAKQLLPEGFLQMRTVSTNYGELRNMYFQRKNHQLPEWSKYFVDWIDTLPYADELIKYTGK